MNTSHSIIGWESETPVPDHNFTDYLTARGGRLFYDDLELAQLLLGDPPVQGVDQQLFTPLEIVYLPRIRQNIQAMRQAFDDAIRETGYAGRFHYTYPSKANEAEEVIRTALGEGVNYEISTSIDTSIVRLMVASGRLTPRQMVICNGVKLPGMQYTRGILDLKRAGVNIIPVVDDLAELQPLIESGLPFEVGIRQKSYGHHRNLAEMEAANSRFGLNLAGVERAAGLIAASPNLKLRLYHAMVGSQITGEEDFVDRLTPPMEIYARLKKQHPSLDIFDFGGGVPGRLSLDVQFDARLFARRLLAALQRECGRLDAPVPDVLGEIGRYTVTEHGAHLFRVISVKENGSPLPWYIIDGSIMSSFPDSWALGDHFIVLPLNHLDKPFRRVQLGGITCDSDDVYPPKNSRSPLYLPAETKDLYIGFFAIGAYQEMLGGAGGAKHCVIPEAQELIIDRDAAGRLLFQVIPGQGAEAVLDNLGYRVIAAGP